MKSVTNISGFSKGTSFKALKEIKEEEISSNHKNRFSDDSLCTDSEHSRLSDSKGLCKQSEEAGYESGKESLSVSSEVGEIQQIAEISKNESQFRKLEKAKKKIELRVDNQPVLEFTKKSSFSSDSRESYNESFSSHIE